MAAAAKIREERGIDVETLWGDDGFVVRFPDVDEPPDVRLLLPDPDEVPGPRRAPAGRHGAVRGEVSRERRAFAAAAEAPARHARAALAAAQACGGPAGGGVAVRIVSGARSRPTASASAISSTCRRSSARSRDIRSRTLASRDGRFGPAVAVCGVAALQLRGELPVRRRRAAGRAPGPGARGRSDAASRAHWRRRAARTARRRVDGRRSSANSSVSTRATRREARTPCTTCCSRIGDLTVEEIQARTIPDVAASRIDALVAATPRGTRYASAAMPRYIAVEDAARYRDALGVATAAGHSGVAARSVCQIPSATWRADSRGHTRRSPRPTFAARYGLDVAVAESGSQAGSTADGRLDRGRIPPGRHRPRVDRRRRAPPAAPTLARQASPGSRAGRSVGARPPRDDVAGRRDETARRRRAARCDRTAPGRSAAGVDSRDRDPARAPRRLRSSRSRRRHGRRRSGVGRRRALGDRDGRIALYLADQLPRLLPPAVRLDTNRQPHAREAAILEHLRSHGASFFGPLHDAIGGGYPGGNGDALWNLVWQGLITNDTFHALRAFTQARAPRRRATARNRTPAFRSRRSAPPSAEGRWTLVGGPLRAAVAGRSPALQDSTAWAAAWAQQLLARHGVLTREAVASEGSRRRIRRRLSGAEGDGREREDPARLFRRRPRRHAVRAARRARSAAIASRSASADDSEAEVVVLSATDPANPYGARDQVSRLSRCGRIGGARTDAIGRRATVILVDGALAAYLARGDRQLLTFLPEAEPQRSKTARAIARALRERSRTPVGEDRCAPRDVD